MAPPVNATDVLARSHRLPFSAAAASVLRLRVWLSQPLRSRMTRLWVNKMSENGRTLSTTFQGILGWPAYRYQSNACLTNPCQGLRAVPAFVTLCSCPHPSFLCCPARFPILILIQFATPWPTRFLPREPADQRAHRGNPGKRCRAGMDESAPSATQSFAAALAGTLAVSGPDLAARGARYFDHLQTDGARARLVYPSAAADYRGLQLSLWADGALWFRSNSPLSFLYGRTRAVGVLCRVDHENFQRLYP